jgi:hypothetical protein
VSGAVNSTTSALVGTNRPELLEGLGTIDGRLVVAGRDCELVVASVGCDTAAVGGSGGGVVSAEVLNDVVLDERVTGPSVDGKIGVAVGLVGTRVGDSPLFTINSVSAILTI